MTAAHLRGTEATSRAQFDLGIDIQASRTTVSILCVTSCISIRAFSVFSQFCDSFNWMILYSTHALKATDLDGGSWSVSIDPLLKLILTDRNHLKLKCLKNFVRMTL